jgi:hypothetical protein
MDDDVEPEPDVPRTAEEIARRALVLSTVIASAFGADKATGLAWLEAHGLRRDISPEEGAFLRAPHTEQQKINFTWRMEAMVPLLWAIRKIDEMPSLLVQAEGEALARTVVFPPAPVGPFLASATLRSPEKIAEEYERVYQAHWRVRDARLFGKPPPADVEAGVVQERHHAFNWIIGYNGQPWDEISTDT